MRWIIVLTISCLTPIKIVNSGEIYLRIGTHTVRALVADTPRSRETGLMQTAQICENCGMLFVFPKAGRYSFWMKNTPLPLSIAFISDDGSILNIEEMQANSTAIHSAKSDATYALEMNKGWFSKHSISPPEFVQGLIPASKVQ